MCHSLLITSLLHYLNIWWTTYIVLKNAILGTLQIKISGFWPLIVNQTVLVATAWKWGHLSIVGWVFSISSNYRNAFNMVIINLHKIMKTRPHQRCKWIIHFHDCLNNLFSSAIDRYHILSSQCLRFWAFEHIKHCRLLPP